MAAGWVTKVPASLIVLQASIDSEVLDRIAGDDNLQTQVDALGAGITLADALAAIAPLTPADGKFPFYTSSNTASLADLSVFARTMLDDADASTARTTLGLGTMSTQMANAVDVTGGDIVGLGSLALTAGVVSGGNLTGGSIGLQGIEITKNFTVGTGVGDTMDYPTDPMLASGLVIGGAITLDFVGSDPIVGANLQTNNGFNFGPRANGLQVENIISYSQDGGQFGLTPFAVQDHNVFQNTPGQDREFAPSWSMISCPIYQADGGTVTAIATDAGGPATFWSQPNFLTKNAGTFDGVTNHLFVRGFVSVGFLEGGASMYGRIGFEVQDFRTAGGIGDFAFPAAGYDNGPGALTENIGISIPILEAGSGRNIGIESRAPIEFRAPATKVFGSGFPGTYNTITDSTLIQSHVFDRDTYKLDFANASLGAQIDMASIVELRQTGGTFGVVTGVNVGTTLQNHSSLTGTVASLNVAVNANPLYRSVSGTATFSTMRTYQAAARVNQSGGTTVVTLLEDFVSQPDVIAGTVTTRRGFTVKDAGSAATVTNNYGLYIDVLLRGATRNLGIYSKSPILYETDATGTFVELSSGFGFPALAYGPAIGTVDVALTRTDVGELTLDGHLVTESFTVDDATAGQVLIAKSFGWTVSLYGADGDTQPKAAIAEDSFKLGPGGSTVTDIAFARTGAAAASLTGQLTLATGLTMTDAKNIAIGATTGTKIGLNSTDKLGFLGATPVVQRPATTDLRQVQIDFGFLATGGATPLNLNGGAFSGAASIVVDGGVAGETDITRSAFGWAVSLFGADGDTVAKSALTETGVQYGPGGSTVADFSFARTGTAAGSITGQLTIATGLTFADAKNVVLNATTGTKIATATSQKLGFWNATPVIQPASANQAAVSTTAPAGGTGATAGAYDSAANRNTMISTVNACVTLVNQLRSDLVAAGIIKGAA